MKKTAKILLIPLTVLLLVAMAGCTPAPAEPTPAPAPAPTTIPTPTPSPAPQPSPAPATEQGTIEIRVTDPPPPGVSSANVTLTKLEVHQVSDNGSGWITIIEDEVTFDLFEIIDQAMTLGSENVTPGKYTQIRAEVTGVEGLTKAGEPYKATVPSGKLKFVRPFNVEAGKTTVLTLDFDGDKSLIMTGKGKFLFKPVVKLLIEEKGEKVKEQEQEQEQEGEEEGEFEGTIKAITDNTTWTMTIDGEDWTVDVSEAEIEGEPAVGLEAEVEGIVVDDTIVASEVEIKEAEEELEFEGTIKAITDNTTWTMTIDGEDWTVDVSEAEIEGEPAVGLEAEVEGIVVDDTIVASEVEIKEAEEEEEEEEE